ncbi:unnamed protein product [Brassica napus]|uniref:(rape) hypothetical protein n=1 Tax=Brassica napus TaxID=3708 RepID=A0A816T0F8_BRANA|nr:unnamed protein product [Brassica napus]
MELWDFVEMRDRGDTGLWMNLMTGWSYLSSSSQNNFVKAGGWWICESDDRIQSLEASTTRGGGFDDALLELKNKAHRRNSRLSYLYSSTLISKRGVQTEVLGFLEGTREERRV